MEDDFLKVKSIEQQLYRQDCLPPNIDMTKKGGDIIRRFLLLTVYSLNVQELSGWVPEQLEPRSRCLSLKYKSDSAFRKIKGKQQELDF